MRGVAKGGSSRPAVCGLRGEGFGSSQPVKSFFVLRTFATRKLLQQRKSLRRCAAGKPAIYAHRRDNKVLKDQVADFVAAPTAGPMTFIQVNVNLDRT